MLQINFHEDRVIGFSDIVCTNILWFFADYIMNIRQTLFCWLHQFIWYLEKLDFSKNWFAKYWISNVNHIPYMCPPICSLSLSNKCKRSISRNLHHSKFQMQFMWTKVTFIQHVLSTIIQLCRFVYISVNNFC